MLLDTQGRILDANDAYCQQVGYSREDLLGMRVEDILETEKLGGLSDNLSRVQQLGSDRFEVRSNRTDGSVVDLEVSVNYLQHEGGRFFAFVRDVTERNRYRAVISQLAAIVESSDDAIIGRNPDGLITVWSTAAERLFGYSAEEAKGKSVSIITPSDRAGELRRISGIARGGERLDHYETVQITKDGRVVDVSVSAFPIIDVDSKPIGSGLIVRDMTERKRFEKAMEVTAREWRVTIDGIRDGILVLDEMLRVRRCNRAMQEQIGAPFSEILGHPCDEFICGKAEDAEDPVYVQALHSRREQAQVFAQGERWISATAYPLLDTETLVSGVVCVLSDITEKRNAVEALKQTTQTLEALIKASPLAIVVLDTDGTVKLWNPASEKVFGWSASEVIGQAYPAVPEGLRGEVELMLKESLQGKVLTGLESRRQRKDGSLIDVSLSTAPLADASGNIVASLGIIADITDRKQAEEALRDSEEKFRTLAASAQDAIIMVDSHLRISFWNGTAESVFGYAQDEAIGMRLNDVVIPGSVPVDGQGQNVDFPGHHESHGGVLELCGRRKDGSEFAAEVSFSRVQTGGKWDGIAIVRDVTPRRMAEEALKESEKKVRELAVESIRAQEEERQWVADAVHDRIAQDLVAAYQQLQILKPLVRADLGARRAVGRALELQQKTIGEARAIMKDLYSPVLDTYGLIPLMEEELHHFQEESGCQTVLKARHAVRFPKHIEGSLYRIFHEGLANIIRHSPRAKNVEVSLTSGHDGVTLKLKDDGSGFDVETAMLSKASGGLIGMRRRAEMISGTFDITSVPGRGATVTVHVPAKYVRHSES
ncbi:MAG: PAS domain S-box protein [Dehalococcoidia bacterium]|nr:PAS domain S-box protein [Dehalococcoidia bacterium]